MVEVSQAISDQLQVQAAPRLGLNFGLTKPRVQDNVQPVIDSVRAALPAEWLAPANADKAVVRYHTLQVRSQPGLPNAVCRGAGEHSQTYLRVDVSKPDTPIVKIVIYQ